MVDIRRFTRADRKQASTLICRCLREINSSEYDQNQIDRLCDAFSPENVERRFSERLSYVAVDAGKIIGTATLKGSELGSVFVNPEQHGQGIGKLLTYHVEAIARNSGIKRLTAFSSLAAIDFYRYLGYKSLGEKCEPDGEVTIEIEKEVK